MVYVDNIVECMFMASDVVFFSFFSCVGVEGSKHGFPKIYLLIVERAHNKQFFWLVIFILPCSCSINCWEQRMFCF